MSEPITKYRVHEVEAQETSMLLSRRAIYDCRGGVWRDVDGDDMMSLYSMESSV